MDKRTIRNHIIELLNKINQEEYTQLSLSIKKRLITSTEFTNAQVIGVTLSRFPEVDTRSIIAAAWALGKQIVVPKCNRETKEMDFRLINSFDNLETVYMNLLEPIISETKSVSMEEIDLQIVPGVVYSKEGFRIGFGGGYYDRYLKDYKGEMLSLAFECQTGHHVPSEAHDIPIGKIFTENDIIDCKKGENSK